MIQNVVADLAPEERLAPAPAAGVLARAGAGTVSPAGDAQLQTVLRLADGLSLVLYGDWTPENLEALRLAAGPLVGVWAAAAGLGATTTHRLTSDKAGATRAARPRPQEEQQ